MKKREDKTKGRKGKEKERGLDSKFRVSIAKLRLEIGRTRNAFNKISLEADPASLHLLLKLAVYEGCLGIIMGESIIS